MLSTTKRARQNAVASLGLFILALAVIGCSLLDLVSGAASSPGGLGSGLGTGRWDGKITFEMHGQATQSITRGTDWEKAEEQLADQGTIEVVQNHTTFDRIYRYSEHYTGHDETDIMLRDVTIDTTITHPAGTMPGPDVELDAYEDGTYTLSFQFPEARGPWQQKSVAHYVCRRGPCLPTDQGERSAEVRIDGFAQEDVEGKVDPSKPNVLSGSKTFQVPYDGHREHLAQTGDGQGTETVTITWNLIRH